MLLTYCLVVCGVGDCLELVLNVHMPEKNTAFKYITALIIYAAATEEALVYIGLYMFFYSINSLCFVGSYVTCSQFNGLRDH